MISYGNHRPEEAAAQGEDRRGLARRAGPGAHSQGDRAGLPAHPGDVQGRARTALPQKGAAAHRPAGDLLACCPLPGPSMLIGYARVCTVDQTLTPSATPSPPQAASGPAPTPPPASAPTGLGWPRRWALPAVATPWSSGGWTGWAVRCA